MLHGWKGVFFMNRRAYGEYIAVLCLFGTNGILASFIPWPSYQIVLGRTAIASVFLLVTLLLRRHAFTYLQHKRSFAILLLSGVFMAVDWLGLYEAYSRMGVGLSSLMCSSGPVLVMMLSPILFHERLTWPKIAGFLAVLAGIVLLNSNTLSSGTINSGMFFALLGACGYACTVVCNKKSPGIVGQERALCQLTVASLAALCFTLCKGGGTLACTPRGIAAMAVLGIVNTGLGTSVFLASMHRLPANSFAILSYMEPLSGIVFSALILGERMTPLQIAGAVLVLGGAAFAELYKGKKIDLKT